MSRKSLCPGPTEHCRAAGFTLIELMIVVAIIIVLSGIAIPYGQAYISSQRLQEVAWQLVEDLRTVRQNAILYQQDLNVYLNYNNAPVEPQSISNTNNKAYWFEGFQYGMDQTTQVRGDHYRPGDAAGSHFGYRLLKYNVIIDSITPSGSTYQVAIGGKKYFIICFRSGAGSSFRGEGDWVTAVTGRANTTMGMIDTNKVVIKLRDPSTDRAFYVTIDGTGKVSMSGNSST